jgi:hypothetical protein
LKIGETYFFEDVDDGLLATVTTATVDEIAKQMYIGTDNGHVLTRPMSDDEFIDYKNHSDAFFGIIHRQGRKAKNEYEFFEDLVDIHMKYPTENILKQMEHYSDIARLKKLSHEDLVLELCERLTWLICGPKPVVKHYS